MKNYKYILIGVLCLIIGLALVYYAGRQAFKHDAESAVDKARMKAFELVNRQLKDSIKIVQKREAMLLKEIGRQDSVIMKIAQRESKAKTTLHDLKPIHYSVSKLDSIWKARYKY